MTSDQFIYWLKGYMAAQIDCQIKLDVEKALNTVTEKTTPHFNYRTTDAASTTAKLSKELLNDVTSFI